MKTSRQDKITATMFYSALSRETIEAMRRRLLKSKVKPDPKSRLGMALIALTTLGPPNPTDDEIVEAVNTASELWTEAEQLRSIGESDEPGQM